MLMLLLSMVWFSMAQFPLKHVAARAVCMRAGVRPVCALPEPAVAVHGHPVFDRHPSSGQQHQPRKQPIQGRHFPVSQRRLRNTSIYMRARRQREGQRVNLHYPAVFGARHTDGQQLPTLQPHDRVSGRH